VFRYTLQSRTGSSRRSATRSSSSSLASSTSTGQRRLPLATPCRWSSEPCGSLSRPRRSHRVTCTGWWDEASSPTLRSARRRWRGREISTLSGWWAWWSSTAAS
ncbi:unnamed protein product, partial [Ectocarpus fasciculatus]